jgi:hypothetical protein
MLLKYLSSFFYSQKEDIEGEDIEDTDIEGEYIEGEYIEEEYEEEYEGEDIEDTDIEGEYIEEEYEGEDIEDTDIEGEYIEEEYEEEYEGEDIDTDLEEEYEGEDIDTDIEGEDIDTDIEEEYEGEDIKDIDTDLDIDEELINIDIVEESPKPVLLEVPEITITENKETVNKRNIYKDYQAYNSKIFLENSKPLIENVSLSFKRMMILHYLKKKVETDTAKEWMAAYKIQQCWKNRNIKKMDKSKLFNVKTPFVYFPF